MEWLKNPLEGDWEQIADFDTERPSMLSLCHEYLDILPKLFANENNTPSYILHHADLNLNNILVNPETFAITGIVDWEMVNVVPSWQAMEYPAFMLYQKPLDEEEPPIPSYEDEDAVSVCIRDRWDYRLLRQRWDETMKRLRGGTDTSNEENQDANADEDKRKCLENIPDLTDGGNLARKWLEKYRAGKANSGDVDEAGEWAKSKLGGQQR